MNTYPFSHCHYLDLLLSHFSQCVTLCDPIDGSPPGSAVLRILQARTLELVAISFSNAWKWNFQKSKIALEKEKKLSPNQSDIYWSFNHFYWWPFYQGKIMVKSHNLYKWYRSCYPLGSVQFSRSVMSDSETPWIATHQNSLSITYSQSSLRLTSIESVMPSNPLILCHSLLFLLSIFPSIRVFSNESILHIRWPKYWSFSFNISPSNEYSGLISFRMDWLYLLAVQGTLKSLLQHHSSKASIVRGSAFFIVQPALSNH